nr:MAG TPA: hypothetical protein [Crassvirales sp.]
MYIEFLSKKGVDFISTLVPSMEHNLKGVVEYSVF